MNYKKHKLLFEFIFAAKATKISIDLMLIRRQKKKKDSRWRHSFAYVIGN